MTPLAALAELHALVTIPACSLYVLTAACDECGAARGSACEPHCTGYAVALDTLSDLAGVAS